MRAGTFLEIYRTCNGWIFRIIESAKWIITLLEIQNNYRYCSTSNANGTLVYFVVYFQVFLISHNALSEIPNDLFRYLTNIRIVDFAYNKLRFLPDNVFRTDGLEKLDLSNNQLSRFPISCISIATAETLSELDLSWNVISSIAHRDQFSKFKSLTKLDLSYNRLVQLDAGSFSAFQRLSNLDLSHNSQLVLERYGKSFLGIEDSLTYLYLDNVSLTFVCESNSHCDKINLAFRFQNYHYRIYYHFH